MIFSIHLAYFVGVILCTAMVSVFITLYKVEKKYEKELSQDLRSGIYKAYFKFDEAIRVQMICEVDIIATTADGKQYKVIHKNTQPAKETERYINFNSEKYKKYYPTWIPAKDVVLFDDITDRRVKIKRILTSE
jgi:hypothetical protein